LRVIAPVKIDLIKQKEEKPMQRIVIAALVIAFFIVAFSSSYAANSQDNITKYFPEPIYVALQASDAVEVLPQQKVFHDFPQAHYIAIGPKGQIMAVSGFQTGQVYIADAKSGKKLATLKIGSVVQGVKFDPDGRLVLVADTSGGSVAVIDLNSLKVTKTIPVGKSPHNIVFSKDGEMAYVTVQGANKLAVIDMPTLSKIAEIAIPGINGPHNLDLANNGHWLWIRSHSSPTQHGSVALLDLATRNVIQTIPVGYFHGGIDRIDGSVVMTTDIGGDTVDVLDRNGINVIKRITVGAAPHGVRISDDGRWAYVTSTGDNEVDVIDMRNLTVIHKIKTDGSFPFWIAMVGNV
jgi:YVTN family beta-propeller protein